MTKVKICGITEPEQALSAAAAGADFLGLVFAAGRHQISISRAVYIARSLRRLEPRPLLAGVFVNFPPGEVNRIAEECNLDWVQLSGNESWEYCLEIERPLIKAIHVAQEDTADEILHQINLGYRLLSGRRFLCLLDTQVEGAYGGTGKTFSWRVAAKVSKNFPVIIAGGLNPANIKRLIQEVHPWGVDVSSGVETSGSKDSEKIKMFVQIVKSSKGSYGYAGHNEE